MKKTIKIYSGLLLICLVLSVLIVAVNTNTLEKKKAVDFPETAGKSNEASVSPKSGLEPENPEFVKYRTNKILNKTESSQEESQKSFTSAFLNYYYYYYYRLGNVVNKYEINEAAISSNSKPVLENPDIIKPQTKENLSQNESSRKKHKTGFVPSPVDRHHLSKITATELSSTDNYGVQDQRTLVKASNNRIKLTAPVSYDLRTLNRVTNVKDQGDIGGCWAFATYASLESYLRHGENWTFSEINMINILSNAYPEGFDLTSNDGGNEYMSTAYLARWSGPVNESDDPYSTNPELSPQNLTIQKHVQNVLYLPDKENVSDNQMIKWAILNYGAVFTTIYYDPTFYSSSTASYYCNGTRDNNHAVAIVGWNDSFDRNLFSSVPPENGAFIVKNSWGTEWGDEGYFNVSYYDLNIGKYNSIFTAESPDNYKYIYQYDPLGWTSNYGYGNPTGWCANVFTAKSDEVLKAVSFYTTDSNCNYEVYIYNNLKSKPTVSAGLVFAQSGSITTAGYHTVPLSSSIQFKTGQKFSVVLKLTNPVHENNDFKNPIAVEKPIDGYSSKARANAGESFVSPDGKTWTDTTSIFYLSNTSVCIKAFTIPRNVLPVANFSANPNSGYFPLIVQFTDLSQNATGWKWDFGDGNNSSEHNPENTYSSEGNYTVTLTTSNKNGTDSMSSIITVLDYKIFPTAEFSANPASGYAPLVVQFTESSQSTSNWNWDFGDGTTSTEQNPAHTYYEAGNYAVNLRAGNANGTASKTVTITVQSNSDGGSSGGSSSGGGSSGGSSSSSGGSGGSGGGGAGGSPEPQSNVEIKELSQTFIGSGQSVKYDFPQKVTPVVSISFDSKKTTGKTTTIVEMLKSKSTLVSAPPSDEIYKYVNIWVGNGGVISSKNIENSVVSFKVEKSWVQDKLIDKSAIVLNRYSDNAWNQLPTGLSSEDDKYLYFSAQTPGFSPFAITGKSTAAGTIESASVNKTKTSNENETQTGDTGNITINTEQPSEQKTFPTVPAFEFAFGVSALFAGFLSKKY